MAAAIAPVAYNSVADIETMMIGLGANEVRRRGIGRYSNHKIWAPVRQASFDPSAQVVVGRIFQHVTARDTTPQVEPHSVIFIFQETSTGQLYLLKTNKGCGPHKTLVYHVYCSNGQFSTNPYVYALQGTAGSSAASQLTKTSPSSALLNSAIPSSAGPSTAQPSQTNNLPAPAPTQPAITNPPTISTTNNIAAATSDEDDQSEAGSPKLSARPKATKGKKAAPKGKKANQKSSGSGGTKPPAIPKSASGVKKTKPRQASPVATRPRSKRLENKGLAKVPGETAEAAFAKAARKGEKAGAVDGADAGEDDYGTGSKMVKLNSSSVLFDSSFGFTPASSSNPLTVNTTNLKKRKREVEKEVGDDEIEQKAKRLLTGWFTSEEKKERVQAARSLVGLHVSRWMPAPTINGQAKDYHMQGKLAQFTLENKRRSIRYDCDGQEIFGSAFPPGMAVQVEVDVDNKGLTKPEMAEPTALEIELFRAAKAEDKKDRDETKKAASKAAREAAKMAKANQDSESESEDEDA